MVTALNGVDPFILGIADNVKAAADDHTKSLTRETVDPDTARQQAADHDREQAFTYLRDRIKNDRNCHDAATAENATVLWSIVLKHGANHRGFSYAEKSAHIEALSAELKDPVNAPLVTALGLDSALANLNATETAFISIANERAGKAGEKRAIPLKSETAATIRKDLHSLVFNFEYKYSKTTDPAYLNAIAALNSLISNEVAIARMRRTEATKAAAKNKAAATVPTSTNTAS